MIEIIKKRMRVISLVHLFLIVIFFIKSNRDDHNFDNYNYSTAATLPTDRVDSLEEPFHHKRFFAKRDRTEP